MRAKRFIRPLLRIAALVLLLIVACWFYLSQPSFAHCSRSTQTVDQERMQAVVKTLSTNFYPRNYRSPENLSKTAEYIAEQFRLAGAEPTFQAFEAWGCNYRNVSVRLGSPHASRIIVGAHYDAYEMTPGADDNASGVAGLIELAFLLGTDPKGPAVELVAYANEEPPFFGSAMMGSAHHAQSITNDVTGVIVLEMIGYFTDARFSQRSPSMLTSLLYPTRGHFIFVVGNLDQRTFTKQVKIGMKGSTDLPVYSINAPRKLPGIDFSDHRNYWDQEMNAVMITDTAFYRNKAYHQDHDTWDLLDFKRMGDVVLGVHSAIKQLQATP